MFKKRMTTVVDPETFNGEGEDNVLATTLFITASWSARSTIVACIHAICLRSYDTELPLRMLLPKKNMSVS